MKLAQQSELIAYEILAHFNEDILFFFVNIQTLYKLLVKNYLKFFEFIIILYFTIDYIKKTI